MTRYEQLKKDLLQNFKDFQDIKHPGGSDAANEIVAEGLAKSIDRAIDAGFEIDFRGEMTCAAINADDRQPGYIYTAKDSGTLAGDPVLTVTANTVVMWDGVRFKTVLKLTPADYSRFIAYVEYMMNNFRVDAYLSSVSQNPVQNKVVTAAIANETAAREQADEALQEQLDSIPSIYETKADAKAKVNNYGVGMRYQNYQTLKFYRPNI